MFGCFGTMGIGHKQQANAHDKQKQVVRFLCNPLLHIANSGTLVHHMWGWVCWRITQHQKTHFCISHVGLTSSLVISPMVWTCYH
jgi:hypothetical protein